MVYSTESGKNDRILINSAQKPWKRNHFHTFFSIKNAFFIILRFYWFHLKKLAILSRFWQSSTKIFFGKENEVYWPNISGFGMLKYLVKLYQVSGKMGHFGVSEAEILQS